MVKIIFALFIVFSLQIPVFAKATYQTSKQFVSYSFNGEIPKSKAIWLSAEDKVVISEIMSHHYNRLRLKYWQQESETVWVLEEIGKEKPITIGVHIKNEQIVDVKVLAYRESRGDEVRHNFLLSNFIQRL